jgi:predicted aminopeptidase
MDFLRALIMLLILTLTSSCQITYYTKSAYQQMWILTHREPIEKVLREKNHNPEDIKKLNLTLRAREFALKNMHLNVGKSYSTFVRLKKPYVVWAVNASEKWKLNHFLWWFPLVGNLPYKGFPNESDAQLEAQSFDKEKYDTYIRGVSAYSTLGWFSDPLLSSMLNYSEHNLVNTIIHESTHATIFIESNADFNERLASFIGNKGTELFYAQEEGKDSLILELIKSENSDENLFSTFITGEIKLLENYYKNTTTKDELERQKQFQNIKDKFQKEIKPHLKTSLYKNFDSINLNNARLLLFKTYVEDLSDFEKLFTLADNNIDTFFIKIKTLEKSKDPTSDLKKLIEAK